jgi:imidazolonepropionase
MMEKTLIIHASQIVTPIGFEMKKGKAMHEICLIEDGAIYIEDGIIKEVGSTEKLLSKGLLTSECKVIDAEGKCVLPGFVDSHTHFIFGGYRQEEFVKRLQGTPYLDILKAGGGIQSTVKSTREADFESLFSAGLKRLDAMLAQGVTTVEGKSGYGLGLETELRQLKVIKACGDNHPMDVAATYLGAHAVPKEYAGKGDDYVAYMIREVLPEVKKQELAEFCDIFCEEGVFDVTQSKKLLEAAKQLGLKIKIHADEIVQLGGGELAAELGASSADHLLMVSDKGIASLAENNVVATLLPATAFCLAKPYAKARQMIDAGCAVALASDLNPGSCFTNSIPLLFALAAIHMKMTPEEALTAMTLNGAAALGREKSIGSIEVGKQADLIILGYPDYRFLVYHTGVNVVERVIKKGRLVYPVA